VTRVGVPRWVDAAAFGPLPDAIEIEVFDARLPEAAEILVSPYGTAEAYAAVRGLEAVLVMSAGVEWIEPHLPAGVVLANGRGARDAAVAEWVLAAILAVDKQLFDLRDAQRAHEWSHRRPPELEGRTALVLGAGSIGEATAVRLEAFGVEVVRVARSRRDGVHGADELPGLLGAAEILVVLVPLSDATRGLVDAAVLAALPDGALVVNAARGAVVDTDALLAELQRGRLRAALDVTDPEPLPADHPLWDAPNTFVSPHLAGDTPQADAKALRLVGEQLRRYARGEPLLNVVER
jgi:phosphoglycerate dehydrogenase-like enzyme